MSRKLLPRVLFAVLVGLTIYTFVSICNQETRSVTNFRNKLSLRVVAEKNNIASMTSGVEECPIPDKATLEKMKPVKLFDFFDGYIYSSQVLCSRRIRMGKVHDGGWDFCDAPEFRPHPGNCLVYSFGINNDFTFDDAMAAFGCEVHSFDPSMGKDDHLHGKNVHFHNAGISGTDETVTVKSTNWSLRTLHSLRRKLNHQVGERQLDMLKMDVEGAEVVSISKALKDGSLTDITQFCFEMHVRTPRKNGHGDPRREYILEMFEILRGLWNLGFRLFHTNRNVALSQTYQSYLDNKMRTATHEIYFLKKRS